MAAAGWVILVIILLILGSGAGYLIYLHIRARRLGIPPPSLNPFARFRQEPSAYRAPAPAPGGIQGWVSDKVRKLRSGRSTSGAYESAGYGGAARSGASGRRAFGPLDPDEAWSAHVDHEAGGYYEEQELGDPGHGPYGGGGYGVGVGGIEEGRGRSRSRQRELDARYDEEVHGGGSGGQAKNPFGDDAQASLRSVSPRPDTTYHGQRQPTAHQKGAASLGGTEESPTERRSMFRENV